MTYGHAEGARLYIHDVALLHNHYYGPVSRVLQLLSLTMIHDHAEKARTTHAEPRYYFLTFLPLPHLSLIEDGPVRLCDLLCMSVDLFAQSSLFRLFVLFLFLVVCLHECSFCFVLPCWFLFCDNFVLFCLFVYFP
jgi:hypothetical protein